MFVRVHCSNVHGCFWSNPKRIQVSVSEFSIIATHRVSCSLFMCHVVYETEKKKKKKKKN